MLDLAHEPLHILQPPPRDRAHPRVPLRLDQAGAERGRGRIELALIHPAEASADRESDLALERRRLAFAV